MRLTKSGVLTRDGLSHRGSEVVVSSAGIDFGTTNSSVALVVRGSQVELASFNFAGAETLSSRSVLYFEQQTSPGGMKKTHALSGSAAIECYLESDEKGRLI